MTPFKIATQLDYDMCVRTLQASGHTVPEIPAGTNTAVLPFVTFDGIQAVAVRQSGFPPLPGEDENKPRGLSIVTVVNEDLSADEARCFLEGFLEGLLLNDPEPTPRNVIHVLPK